MAILRVNGQERELPDGGSIISPCEELGLPFACKEGFCGSCLIEVVEGMEQFSPPTQEERDFLGNSSKERLACQCSLISGSAKIQF